MAGIALVISILGVGLIARSVTRPLQHLTAALRRVSEGDYHGPVEIGQKDEIGELAAAFNRMVEGLAERDRVRDLLGKVMSPQIACELLGGDVELGGEERTVTVLFADVRDFTTLSEKLAARELLALLNEYLTEMSDVIEANDGVVDKYIGDAIMALSGAPLGRPNDAARAIRAALGMDKALDALNLRLASRGQPGSISASASTRPRSSPATWVGAAPQLQGDRGQRERGLKGRGPDAGLRRPRDRHRIGPRRRRRIRLSGARPGPSQGPGDAAAHELMEARDEKRLLRFQKQLAKYSLLVIDELGFVPLSKTGAELLFEVFSQRYERGATLVTSNLPFDEWTKIFGSERLTGALLDRLTHHVHILEMNGESYRLNQSQKWRKSPKPPA